MTEEQREAYRKEAEERREREKARKAFVIAKLKELGVELHVGGCGCCDSPWVTLKIGGETIVDDADNFCLDERDYQAS